MKNKRRAPNAWVIARRSMQTLALLVFVVTLLLSKKAAVSPGITAALVRISPLAMLSELLSSKQFLAGSALALVILLSSLLVGRAWCGWLCPMGTVLDIFHLSKARSTKEPPQKLRKIKYGLLLVILFLALLGNLTLLFLDPVTIFIRSTTVTIIPVVDRIIYALEMLLIKIPFLRNSVYAFDGWLRPGILPVESPSVQYAFLFGLFFTGIILLNLIAERFWCRYLCPLGALLGLGAKLSLIQRRVKDECVSCGLCAKDCPTGTIDAEKQYSSDPSECTLCMECLQSCNKHAIVFTPQWSPAKEQAYDPDRRTFLSTLGISALMTSLFGVDWLKQHPNTFQLRPPGVYDPDVFLSTCVRCGVCVQVCPTQALQPDMGISGIEGLATPLIVPRNGYCSYTCNACGQNCPVQAIPPLSLEEKRLTKIGSATIDHNRCIAWSDHNNCIVCEEMCPLPEKAITLDTHTFTHPDGYAVDVLLPVVDRAKCIGCGICENKCPVAGEAAIRVHIA